MVGSTLPSDEITAVIRVRFPSGVVELAAVTDGVRGVCCTRGRPPNLLLALPRTGVATGFPAEDEPVAVFLWAGESPLHAELTSSSESLSALTGVTTGFTAEDAPDAVVLCTWAGGSPLHAELTSSSESLNSLAGVTVGFKAEDEPVVVVLWAGESPLHVELASSCESLCFLSRV